MDLVLCDLVDGLPEQRSAARGRANRWVWRTSIPLPNRINGSILSSVDRVRCSILKPLRATTSPAQPTLAGTLTLISRAISRDANPEAGELSQHRLYAQPSRSDPSRSADPTTQVRRPVGVGVARGPHRSLLGARNHCRTGDLRPHKLHTSSQWAAQSHRDRPNTSRRRFACGSSRGSPRRPRRLRSTAPDSETVNRTPIRRGYRRRHRLSRRDEDDRNCLIRLETSGYGRRITVNRL